MLNTYRRRRGALGHIYKGVPLGLHRRGQHAQVDAGRYRLGEHTQSVQYSAPAAPRRVSSRSHLTRNGRNTRMKIKMNAPRARAAMLDAAGVDAVSPAGPAARIT